MATQQTQVSICNQALGWLGANLITSFDDEGSVEASLCKTNYPSLRDAVLEDHEWSFAIKRAKLAPLTDADGLWEPAKAFQIPEDALRILDVSADGRFRSNEAVDWSTESNKILVYQRDLIYIKFIWRVEDVTKYSPKFAQALAARIAYDLAAPITESPDIVNAMYVLYQEKLATAAATDGMQGTMKRVRSHWMRNARQGLGSSGAVG